MHFVVHCVVMQNEVRLAGSVSWTHRQHHGAIDVSGKHLFVLFEPLEGIVRVSVAPLQLILFDVHQVVQFTELFLQRCNLSKQSQGEPHPASKK